MTRASFGDVTGEYRALHETAGVVAARHELVRVVGPDAESFLDSLLSQALAGLADGVTVRSLLLGPRGKLRALLWVARFGEEFLLATDAGTGETVAADLTRFKLRVRLDILPPEPVLDLVGPAAGAVLEAAGAGSPLRALAAPLGRIDRYLVPDTKVEQLVSGGAREVGQIAYTAVRVEMGEPVMGEDVDESTIPQEAGVVEAAVSFSKGCYLGQELVARIDARGHVNRHLRGLVLTRNALPPPGAEVVAEGTPVGTITSVSESLRVGAPVGLGLLRREVAPGSAVEIRWPGGGAGAEVRALPLV